MSEQKIVEDLKERYDRCCDPDDECYSAWEATLIERISRAESQVASLTAERDECNRMLVIESNAAEEYQKALTTERGLRDASEQENGLLRSERDEAQRREIVVGDLSMLIRMMVTKHRRGLLPESAGLFETQRVAGKCAENYGNRRPVPGSTSGREGGER
jgi:hypothetical protein